MNRIFVLLALMAFPVVAMDQPSTLKRVRGSDSLKELFEKSGVNFDQEWDEESESTKSCKDDEDEALSSCNHVSIKSLIALKGK